MQFLARSIQARFVALLTLTLLMGAAIAGASLFTLRSSIGGYEQPLDTDVRDREDARRMQVTFKKQVQEWKDILLRGDDSASLKKYTGAFHERSADVDAIAAALRKHMTDSSARVVVDSFAHAHDRMGKRYEQSLAVFAASGGRAMHEADKLVKGQDRAPTDLTDSLVKRLDARVNDARADRRSSALAVARWLTVLLVVTSGLAWLALVWFARTLVRLIRALEEAAGRVAGGNMSDPAVAEMAKTHDDEIGRLAGAFHTMTGSLRAVLGSVERSATEFEQGARELADGTAQLSATTEQVQGAAESVAFGALQQTQGMEALEAATLAVGRAASTVAERANHVLATTERAHERATAGAASATSALERLNEISGAARNASRVAGELTERSARIGEITDGVEALARQTNLLALNAAIEAPRAGDQGRGFAVIAEEVRSLADESARSLKLIHKLVSEINDASSDVSRSVDAVTKSVVTSENVIGASSGYLTRIHDDMTASHEAVAAIGEDAKRLLAQSLVLTRELRSVAAAADGHAATSEQMNALARQQSQSTMELAEAGERMAVLAGSLRATLLQFGTAEYPAVENPSDPQDASRPRRSGGSRKMELAF